MGNDYFKFMENDYYESTPHTIKKELNNFKNVGGLVTASECDVKLNLLSALQNEQQLLLAKMKKAMDEDNIGTYKNLVMALKEITHLVQNEQWVQKWSKYSCNDKKYVAVWEQKGSDIKNHKTFEIKDCKDILDTILSDFDDCGR